MFLCIVGKLCYQELLLAKSFSLSHKKETQLLCLLAGANSIFYGDSLLTTENNQMDDDRKLLSEFSNKDFLKSDNNRL